MKRILGLTIAAAAFTAPALQAQELPADWEVEPLYSDWRITNIMDGAVYTAGDKKVGEVHDVILGEDGLVRSVVVQQETDNELGWNYFEVNWSETEFDPALGHVDLEMTMEQVKARDTRELPDFAGKGEFEASDLLGMPTNLDNDRPYGEIANITISPTVNDATSFIVSSDGIGDMQFAVPANMERIDYSDWQVNLPYLVDDVEEQTLWVVTDTEA